MRVHLINAIAWAGVIVAIGNALSGFKQMTVFIMISGFFLEMLLFVGSFRELRKQNNKKQLYHRNYKNDKVYINTEALKTF